VSEAIRVDGPEPIVGSYFVATYPPFSCWDTADAGAWLDALDSRPAPDTPLGLYVHVPFCVRRCTYCYYLSVDDRPELLDRYLEALGVEAARLARAPAVAGRAADFVYVGGGTPSMLSPGRCEGLFNAIRSHVPLDETREITFECAPRSITRDKLRALKAHGVTRISMGVQQLDDEVLQASGRVHRTVDVLRAWDRIREIGFPVENLDLMVGMVGETDESFFRGLERVLELEPASITLYPLEIPLNTPLYRAIQDGTVPREPADWTTKRRRMRAAFERLESSRYTVRSTNAAVRDPERHAFLYQELQYRGADLLGLGVASFSYVSGVHHQNAASLSTYLRAAEEDRPPLGRAHVLSEDERAIREFILQLKLGRVERVPFRARHGVDPATRFEPPLRDLQDRGWIRIDDDAIAWTPDGRVQADRMLPGFYRPEHRGLRYS
jgi:oxygen-independent coproporphyrinogen-3 oxidase